MKKTYAKPEIAFDDFTLSNTIAASCERYSSAPSRGQCGYINISGERVFYAGGMSGCEDVHYFPEVTGWTYAGFVNAYGIFNSL